MAGVVREKGAGEMLRMPNGNIWIRSLLPLLRYTVTFPDGSSFWTQSWDWVDTGVTDVLTPAEARKLFNDTAQYWLNISGWRFLQLWDRGQLDRSNSAVQTVAGLIPLVRPDQSDAV